MPGRLEFDLGFGRTGRPRDDSEPMRLLVLGDFSGKRGGRAAAARRAGRHSEWTSTTSMTSCGGCAAAERCRPATIRFEQIDDFHPDRLVRAARPVPGAAPGARQPAGAHDDDLLGRLLGKPSAPSAAPRAAPASGLDALIRNIVAPHIVKDTSAQTRPHLAAVDAAIAEQMRALLHAPAFQSLEAAWRGVQWLISSLELDENLQLHLFDVTREELLADIVAAQGKLAQTGLYRALVDRWRNVPGAERLVGARRAVPFRSVGCRHRAARCARPDRVARRRAAARRRRLALAGDDASALAGWQALRRSEAAPWIGLAAPRVLLRLPYGKGSDPIEAFAFEEFVGAPVHEEFLWGNAVAGHGAAHRQSVHRARLGHGAGRRARDRRSAGVHVRAGRRAGDAGLRRTLPHREPDRHAAEGRTRADRQPPRSQCGGRGSLSVGLGSAGAAGLVRRRIREPGAGS